MNCFTWIVVGVCIALVLPGAEPKERTTPVSLAKVANMGFRDEKAKDRAGGWTDQGPDNDLGMFPTGRREFGGVLFDIAVPERNGGKGCLILRGPSMPWLPDSAEVVLPEPAAGKYLYILTAVGWEKPGVAGEIVVEYDRADYVERETARFPVRAGEETANFLNPRRLNNAATGYRSRNSTGDVGLYLAGFELTGAPVRSIRFESGGKMVWMIAGVSLSDIPPRTEPPESVVMKANEEWLPVKFKREVRPGSVLDFSHLLDAPAGKHGFLKTAGGHFEFAERPGVPVRFYGANICFDANFMNRELVDRMVRQFAATGYNMVRLHHFDNTLSRKGGKSTELDPERLAELDYLVHAFKQRGIYISLDLFTIRKLGKGELPDFPERAIQGELKALVFIRESARENFAEFAANLLNHVNPHTQLAWKDEPAIANLSILNEDTIFATVRRSPFIRELYEAEFQQWLKKKRVTADGEWLWRAFLSETARDGYDQLAALLRELGVKAPLTDQNFWGTLPLTAIRERFDYVDNHFYWSHPSFLGKNWGMPQLVNNRSAITDYAGGVGNMFPTRIYGKPFTVSEWNYCGPNPHQVEGAFLTGAYAAFQDWSGLCRFAYAHSSAKVKSENLPVGNFDVAADPLRILSERVGVCFFLRGDVAPARRQFPVLVNREYWSLKEGVIDFPAGVRRLGLLGGTGALMMDPARPASPPPGTALLLTLPGGNWKGEAFSQKLLPATGEDLVRRAREAAGIAASPECFISDTGELMLDRAKTQFRASTPRSEGLLLEGGSELAGSFASVKNEHCFAGFLFAAVDGRPLTESSRLLILHLTDVKNTGMRFRDREMNVVEAWGKPPVLLRRGRAEVSLQRDFTGFRLYAVDFDGSRLGEIPLTAADGATRFTLDTALHGGVAAYELIR